MRDLEYPAEDRAQLWPEATTPTRFIVEAIDGQRRFSPLVFAVNVPFEGVFPTATLSSPEESGHPGCWLFAAPSRSDVPATAAIRAHLTEANSETPAAYAVVDLSVGGETWHGVADDQGRVLILFPYPDFTSPMNFTSPVTTMPPQSWPVSIRVRYQPGVQETPDGAAVPDIQSLFSQAMADIWLTESGVTDTVLALDFKFGEKPVLRTDDRAYLWLSASASPP
jgi:hypothetical protein